MTNNQMKDHNNIAIQTVDIGIVAIVVIMIVGGALYSSSGTTE